MKKSLWFYFVPVLALVAVFAFTQQAQAAERHWHVTVIPHNPGISDAYGAAPAAGFYGDGAFFVSTSLNQPGNAFTGPWPGTNYPTGAPNDLWPCFGGDTTGDCATIDGTQSNPGSIVQGSPSYTWYLTANTATAQPYGCNGTTSGDEFKFCAQANNYYEDDSNDTTDDLLWSMTVTQKQGTSTVYLYDSGTQDYGPNPYGGFLAADDAPPTIVFYEDLNFGLLGQSSPQGDPGSAIGPCFGDYQYPIPANYTYGLFNTFGANWGIDSKKTCVAPAAGLATVTITTWLAPATYTTVTSKNYTKDCPGMSGAELPCTLVKYGAKAHSLSQKFTIWLR